LQEGEKGLRICTRLKHDSLGHLNNDIHQLTM